MRYCWENWTLFEESTRDWIHTGDKGTGHISYSEYIGSDTVDSADEVYLAAPEKGLFS